jgi:tRNA(His) 5'-end guanylyltransferase
VSVSASVASVTFNAYGGQIGLRNGYFDSRVFSIPEREVVNYFIWRQQDATRNSIQMVAQNLYSHKQLLNKNTEEQQEMIFQKGVNWNDYSIYWKRGRIIIKDYIDAEIPIFSRNRECIEKFMVIEEE